MFKPVKYIVGILTNETDKRSEIISALGSFFGECDFQSKWYPFTFSDYYADEMGSELQRSFVAFEKLQSPDQLAGAKEFCVEVEKKFSVDGKRTINLDPGFIDYFKIVLATGKFGGYKIPLRDGIYADMIMTYSKGKWSPMPWCFPDFRTGAYDGELTEMRRMFKGQVL